MKKLSGAITGFPGLTTELLLSRLKQVGPGALASGAALAGISHLLSLKDMNDEAENENKKDNTLVIQVPQKTANPSFGQYAWDAPAAAVSTLFAGGVGYTVVDSILKRFRQKQMDDELNSTKKQYANYLGQELAPKTASICPILDGFLMAVVDQTKGVPVEESRKQAALKIIKSAAVGPPTVGTMFTSTALVPALFAAVAAHQYYYNREKDVDRAVEKDEADKMQKTPQYVKIQSVPPVAPSAQGNPLLKGAEEDEGGGILEGGILASLMSKAKAVVPPHTEDKPHKDHVFSASDVSEVNPRTLVLSTDAGNTQIEALDPQALTALQSHKDQILKGFALGANV